MPGRRVHGKIKSIGMEIRESKERADVEEVFRKKGGTRETGKNHQKIRDSRTYEGRGGSTACEGDRDCRAESGTGEGGYPVGE